MKILITLLLGLFLLQACNNPKSSLKTDVDEIPVKTVKGFPILISQFCSDVSYIRLETNTLNPIGTIDKIILNRDRIYFLDSKTNKILVFGYDGKFITQTDNIGRGPGEYLNISDFLIDSQNDNIELWDNANKKIMRMDRNGKFLNERPFPLHVDKFCKLSSNTYLYYACNSLNPEFFKNESFNAIILDSSNNLISSFLPIKETRYLKSGENSLFVKYDNGANISVPYDNQLYHVSLNGSRARYKIKFLNHNPPDNYLESFNKIDWNDRMEISKRFIQILNETNENSYIKGIYNIFENNKFLFFQYRVPKVGTYTAIYSKKTKKVSVGIPENDLDLGLFGEPLAFNGDTLITYIYPSDLIKKVKLSKLDESSKRSGSKYIGLIKLSDSLQEGENPIIAKFVFKDF
jgi:hypothetical protein